MADESDAAIIMQREHRHIVRQTLKLFVLRESETLFNVIIRNGPTTGKRLMIYVKASLETYNELIIHDIIWIPRKYNFADAMAVATISQQFVNELRKGNTYYTVERFITKNSM